MIANCMKCNQPLIVNDKYFDYDDVVGHILVEPCLTCLDEERSEALHEGFLEGQQEGLDEGIRLGRPSIKGDPQ